MLKLIATLYESGRCIIKKEGRYYNIVPPYVASNPLYMEEGAWANVEAVTSGYGYILLKKPLPFETPEELHAHLEEEYEKWRVATKQPDFDRDKEKDPYWLLKNLAEGIFKVFAKEAQKRFRRTIEKSTDRVQALRGCLGALEAMIAFNEPHRNLPEMKELEAFAEELKLELSQEEVSTPG